MPTKAKKILDWEPKVRFRELVEIMVDADMELLRSRRRGSNLGNCLDRILWRPA